MLVGIIANVYRDEFGHFRCDIDPGSIVDGLHEALEDYPRQGEECSEVEDARGILEFLHDDRNFPVQWQVSTYTSLSATAHPDRWTHEGR